MYFRDRKKHTGLVVVLRGEVLASFTVPTEDGAEGIRRAMRDLGVGGPQTSGSTSSFSSSSAPFRSSPPAASSPFSSSSYPPPPGRSPAPLVRRDDLLWPPDQDEDEDGRNEGDFLPGWSSVR